ncbi:MFS transporter [Pediococcus siamensis]|uniref:MFS transporter n=1 Tax=Pediococcus siamensis TaxID=381829 RepID=UPI0039A1B4E5
MVENKTNHPTMLKIGILSISFMLQAASAISVAVTGMIATFHGQSATSVQTLVTIPSFSIMLFILLDSWFIKLIGKRNTVFLGLVLALVGGIGPAFVSNFAIIEVLRFLFGAGTGLYTPLAVSLIGDFFTGDEQKNLLGVQSALSTFGSSFATFVAGILAGINWRSTFLVYLILAPVFVLFYFGFPKSDKKENTVPESKTNEPSSNKTKLPVFVIIGMLTLFVYFWAAMAVYTNSGLAIQQLNLSNQGFLGTALAISGLLGALVVMSYGPIFKALKHTTPIAVCIVGAIGFVGMAHVTNMFMFTLYAVLISSTSLLIPYVYGTVLDSAPDSSKNFAISMAMVLNNLGAYFSPYALSFLGKLFGKTDAVSSFSICAGIMAILAVVFILLTVIQQHSSKTVKA